MAFTVTAGTVASKTTGTTLTPALPDLTGATTGTLLVCRLYDVLSTSQPATPAGWTAAVAASQAGGADNWTVMYWRYWASGMAAPSFTGLASNNGTAQIIRVEGAASSAPIDSATGLGTTTNTTTLTLPSVTPSVDGCLIVVSGTEGNSGATNIDLSLDIATYISKTYMNAVGTNDARSVWGYVEQTTAAASATSVTWTGASAHGSMARLVILPGSTTVSLNRTAAESITLTDAASRSTARARNTSESIALADAATRSSAFARTAAESIALTDAATRAPMGIARTATDGLALADAAAVTSVQTSLAANEGIGLSDVATADVGGDLSRSVTDAIALTDAAGATVATSRTATDTIGLADVASTDAPGAVTPGSRALMTFYGG